MLVKDLPQNKGAIYLQNTAGVHYDVVLQVCSNVADISYTCCENFTFKSADNFTEHKQKHASTFNDQNSKLLNDSKTHIQAENFNDVHKKDENYKKKLVHLQAQKNLMKVQNSQTILANQIKVPN